MAEGGTPSPKVPTTPVTVSGPEQVWDQYFGDQQEQLYIFNDIRERHLAVLLQDGDDFYWLRRKTTGTVCPHWNDQSAQCLKPLDPKATCYNTKFIGGYEAPLLIKAALPSSTTDVVKLEGGMLKTQPMKCWTIWEPRLDEYDMIVNRQTGERYEIVKVTLSGPWRGLVIAQFFDVRLLQYNVDFAAKVPVPLIEGA